MHESQVTCLKRHHIVNAQRLNQKRITPLLTRVAVPLEVGFSAHRICAPEAPRWVILSRCPAREHVPKLRSDDDVHLSATTLISSGRGGKELHHGQAPRRTHALNEQEWRRAWARTPSHLAPLDERLQRLHPPPRPLLLDISAAAVFQGLWPSSFSRRRQHCCPVQQHLHGRYVAWTSPWCSSARPSAPPPRRRSGRGEQALQALAGLDGHHREVQHSDLHMLLALFHLHEAAEGLSPP